jgi:glycosyltransferase involved in cell wall biosynthesis
VAVQLQGPGAESGAAVAELLAAGVPTVVADIGPMSELPGDVAIKFDATGTAAQLAQLITGVLTDDEGRDALSQAARGHARAHSFAHAAHVLAGVLFA